MKKIMMLFCMCVIALGCNGGSSSGSSGVYTADHTSIAKFASLTDAQLDSVRDLKIFMQHASVGNNLYNGMSDLATSDSTKYGFTTTQVTRTGDGSTDGSITSLKTWYGSTGSTGGWGDYYEDNPGWDTKVSDFTKYIDTCSVGTFVDVAMMKLCYIDNQADYTAQFETYRDAMLALETAYPSVKFIWWTMPIKTQGDVDNDDRLGFNTAVRNYASANKKNLFDIADIECHNSSGTKLTDSYGENLCSDYTKDGGHLNDDAGLGRERVAKAMWVLLANIGD